MSLRIVPSPLHASSTAPTPGAPSAPGVHDTLRSNLSLTLPAPKAQTHNSNNLALQSTHPLEARLTQWRAQQDSLKMSLLRRQFGIAEPVKRGMEMAIVRAGEWRPACLDLDGGFGGDGLGGVHSDILSGRDWELDWEDVFVGGDLMRGGWEGGDFHSEMEGRFGMGW